MGRSLLAGAAPASATSLAQGVLRAMTFTKWMTIAAAMVVLGAVGGGVRVVARQDGTPATKSQGRIPTQEDRGRPARKALEEVQSWINRYEEQLAARRDEIADQKKQIKELNDRIRALETQVKPRDIVIQAPPVPANPTKAAGANESTASPVDDKGPLTDRIIPSETAIVSIAGSKDLVIIYGTLSHRSRTYRLPHHMKDVEVSFHGDDVIIVANGPHGAHLAAYNLKTDRWALQDLRGGTQGHAAVAGSRSNAKEHVLPCLLVGSGFTQVAVFDFGRGSWSIQNLLEPSENWVRPIKQGRLAMYVLGRQVYAYRADTGTWDTLTLEEKLLPETTVRQNGLPLLSDRQDMFAVSQHGRLHVFTANAGRWETVNPKD